MINYNQNELSLEQLKGLRCCLYCRCSTEEESQVNALVMQAEISRQKAKQLGLNITAEYIESVTGTSTEHRTQYKQMMSDMTRDKWDVIVIKCEDRLNRNELDWFIFQQELIQNHKVLYMWLSNTIFNSDRDRFISGIKAIMNREFSKNISVKGHNAHRFRQINHTGFNFPHGIYGWDKVAKDKYVLNEEQANFLRQAVQMVLNGLSLHNVAVVLNEKGAVSTNGKYMYPCNWKAHLRSERLYGCVVSNKYQIDFDSHTRVEMPKDQWIYWENALPPIIDKDTWDEVQDVLDEREEHSHKGYKFSRYALSGKLYCGKCGSVMHRCKVPRHIRTTNTNKDYVSISWECRQRHRFGIEGHENSCSMQLISEEILYKTLLDNAEKYFGQLFTSKNSIIDMSLKIISRAFKQVNNGNDLESIKRKINDTSRRQKELLYKLLDKTITEDTYKRTNSEFENELTELNLCVENIEKNHNGLIENERRLKEIKALLETSDIIEFANADVVLKLVDRIDVNPDSTMTVMFNKNRVFEMMGIDIVKSIANEVGDLVMTMKYNGWQLRHEYVVGGACELFKVVKEHPDWSYKQYADELGWTVVLVSSRFRVLRNKGFCKRDKKNMPWTILKDIEE